MAKNHNGKNNKELIIELYNDGFGLRDIANALNVSHMTIYRVIKRY